MLTKTDIMTNKILKYRILQFCLAFFITNASAQIISSNAFLQGDFVEVGMAPCGSFGSTVIAPDGYHPRGDNDALGFVADPAKDGWNVGSPNFVGDYFLPGTPEEGWGLTINGINYNNNIQCGQNEILGSIIDYTNTSSEVSATWEGAIDGLGISSRTSIPNNAAFFITKVTIVNTSDATINDVYYMRNVDPDQGVYTPGAGGDYETTNSVVSQNPNATNTALAGATSAVGDNFLGLGSIDSRAMVTHGGFSNRSALDIWNANGLNASGSTYADSAISISFNLGALEPNQSTTFSYVYILSIDDIDIEAALNATSTVSDIACTTATLNATSNLTSTGYWMVVPDGATPPTASQIKNGTDYDSVTAVSSGSGAVTANVETPFNITGLTANTSYDIYFVSEDATPAFSTIAEAAILTLETCDTDSDGDGVNDDDDNCPDTANADQANYDGDAQGDVCDPDDDNDGILDVDDNCPFEAYTAPTITCPTDISVPSDDDNCGAYISLGVPTIMDNCATTGNALNLENSSNGFKNIPDFTSIFLNSGTATISGWINPRSSNPIFPGLEIYGKVFEINKWQHIALTYDSSTLKIYHNGLLIGSLDANLVQLIDIIENITISSFPFLLDGELDEVRAWNVVRTQVEIQENMDTEIDAQPGLVALYHFNQGIAGGDNTGLITVVDDSGYGNDITLTNFTLNGPTSNWVEGKTFYGVTLTNDLPAYFYTPIVFLSVLPPSFLLNQQFWLYRLRK